MNIPFITIYLHLINILKGYVHHAISSTTIKMRLKTVIFFPNILDLDVSTPKCQFLCPDVIKVLNPNLSKSHNPDVTKFSSIHTASSQSSHVLNKRKKIISDIDLPSLTNFRNIFRNVFAVFDPLSSTKIYECGWSVTVLCTTYSKS